jgi:hypothetical protein
MHGLLYIGLMCGDLSTRMLGQRKYSLADFALAKNRFKVIENNAD